MRLLYHLKFSSASFLKNEGFFTSFYRSFPTDTKDQPIPWMNYSVIYFLRSKLNKKLTLFEYGSGGSTIFYMNLVKKVCSLEHNEVFFDFMKESYPQIKDSLFFEGSKELYPKAILNFENLFDVIVIDGIQRCECLDFALECLSPTGIIIFDDTDRKSYWKKIESLLEENFKELTFVGIKPCGISFAQTTIIYRSENCLNI